MKDNALYTPGYQGRFIDALAGYCEQITCFLHRPRGGELEMLDYRIRSKNVRLVDIGPRTSVMHRCFHSGRFLKPFLKEAEGLDALLIRSPTPLLCPVAEGLRSVPSVLLIVGDHLRGIDALPQPFWRKEAIRLWARWNKWQQDRIAGQTLTFVNSRELFLDMKKKVSEIVEIKTTTLQSGDFFERDDTCQAPPYRLLYVGRLSRAKGLQDILQAMVILRGRGIETHWDIVGASEPGESIRRDLEKEAAKQAMQDRVVFHGYHSIENELFNFYRKADVFVLASRLSEGFPRVIWEAMASSLPVVATAVGAIPDYAGGAVRLAEALNPESLAGAIGQVVGQKDLRGKMIREGLRLSRANTGELVSGEMIRKIQTWLDFRRGSRVAA